MTEHIGKVPDEDFSNEYVTNNVLRAQASQKSFDTNATDMTISGKAMEGAILSDSEEER